jgi:hypothetical protein
MMLGMSIPERCAPYAKEGEVMLRLTAMGLVKRTGREMMAARFGKGCVSILGRTYYGIEQGEPRKKDGAELNCSSREKKTRHGGNLYGGLQSKRITEYSRRVKGFAGGITTEQAMRQKQSSSHRFRLIIRKRGRHRAGGVAKAGGIKKQLKTDFGMERPVLPSVIRRYREESALFLLPWLHRTDILPEFHLVRTAPGCGHQLPNMRWICCGAN